ncbi:MAG: hypothetical protein SAJ12_11705 [Jaaginema sp. PMC 1079.18]|nr:hypothetical protein [Jaaginema sp. PMC 1080.18]MEC4851670.1 hypothetical protein [Jaaginema sp. PMC 1079.18]MEC4868336.1 hypothetical protein [Jaaginema sp. PMC 1078.18]
MIVNPSSSASLMSETLDIQELAISLYAENLPTALSRLDFLRFSGIIPQDWQTTGNPVEQDNLSQIQFANGVNVLAQPRSVKFFEAIASQTEQNLNVPTVTRCYSQCLPHVLYQALSINPQIVTILPRDNPDKARQQFLSQILAPELSQEMGRSPLQIAVNLVYPLDRCQFNLSISEVRVTQNDQSQLPAILFSGSFNYDIQGKTASERLEQLQQALDNWQTDLETFRKLVHRRLPNRLHSIFPNNML